MATARQLRPRNSGRKSEVVFNLRAGTGLSSGGVSFDHNRRQALGRCIDRSGQACGACSDNRNVIDPMRFRNLGNPQLVSKIADGWPNQDTTVQQFDLRHPRRRQVFAAFIVFC